MKTAGIIAEYNPFHNGHAYQIKTARQQGATHIVSVMSGNFVQRGEPAVMPTCVRAEAALDGGADLVLQLPVPYATAGAADFAFGGVSVLNATGVVDELVFGSECGNREALLGLSDALRSPDTDARIKELLASGITYAAAREKAVAEAGKFSSDILRNPNDILAIEYINAIGKLNSAIEPLPFLRVGAGHDSAETGSGIASAGEIRRRIKSGEEWNNFVPDEKIYSGCRILDNVAFNKFETAVLYKMRTITADELRRCPDVSEGIENRILSAAGEAGSLEELYALVKTKRYTHARIRRIVLSAFLGIEQADVKAPVPYIRILGFNDRGAELIRKMKTEAKLPVVTKAADISLLSEKARRCFSLESRASAVAALIYGAETDELSETKHCVIKKI